MTFSHGVTSFMRSCWALVVCNSTLRTSTFSEAEVKVQCLHGKLNYTHFCENEEDFSEIMLALSHRFAKGVHEQVKIAVRDLNFECMITNEKILKLIFIRYTEHLNFTISYVWQYRSI